MRSIRSLLMVTYLGVTFVSTVVLGVCLLYAVEHSYVGERRQELAAHAGLVSNAILDAVQRDAAAEEIRTVCENLSKRMRVRIILTATDGQPVVDTSPADLVAAFPSAPQGRFGCHLCHSETVGARHLRITVPLPAQAHAESVTLLQPAAGLERTTRRIRRVTLIILLTTLLVMGLVSGRLSSRLASAVSKLNVMARRMAEGDLDQQVQIKTPDELAGLADSLNEMARRIRFAMNALAEEKNKLETAVAQMADGIIVTDAEACIVVFNPACERIFGVTAASVVGRHVYGATFSPGLQRAIIRALAGETTEAEMKLRYPALKLVHGHVSPFRNAEGTTQGAMVVIQDRTEAYRLAQSQREFVANASHELRTPIASVHTTAEALLLGAKEDPVVRDRFISALVQETGRLSSLVKDILTLSRMEAQGGPPEKTALDVREVVDDVLELLRPAAGHRKLRISAEVPTGLQVSADRTQLTQAVANLVDNAIKYTPDGGKVSVAAGMSNGSITITVSDTGMGIPPEEHERVFERFYRVDQARSRDLGGTGLGLSIARQVATAHGGSISVESQPGHGSRFTITLPAG